MAERLGDFTSRIIQERHARPLTRAIIALGSCIYDGPQRTLEFARRAWPNDRRTIETIERAAVIPTSTTTTDVPKMSAVSDVVSIIGPMSASGQIFSRAIGLELGRMAAITVPTLVASATGVGFVAQAAPIPVQQLAFGGPSLTTKKLALLAALTRELFESGTNAEILIRAALSENLSLGLDGILLDSTASDTTRPAGLRAGVSAIGATAGGGQEAMIKDLSNLATTVAAVAGSQDNIIFIAAPGEAVRINMRVPSSFRYPVFSSAGLASGVVLCLAVNALAVAADPAIRYEVARHTAVHMETAPSQIATVGTPNVIAAPVRSLFQTDAVGVKLLIEMDWALRTTGAIAWTQTVTW